MKKIPRELNRIVDKVLAYKPKPKSKAAKRRAEQVAARIEEPTKWKRAAD
jgi:hypothetical protein